MKKWYVFALLVSCGHVCACGTAPIQEQREYVVADAGESLRQETSPEKKNYEKETIPETPEENNALDNGLKALYTINHVEVLGGQFPKEKINEYESFFRLWLEQAKINCVAWLNPTDEITTALLLKSDGSSVLKNVSTKELHPPKEQIYLTRCFAYYAIPNKATGYKLPCPLCEVSLSLTFSPTLTP